MLCMMWQTCKKCLSNLSCVFATQVECVAAERYAQSDALIAELRAVIEGLHGEQGEQERQHARVKQHDVLLHTLLRCT